jgi:hypothetical protein
MTGLVEGGISNAAGLREFPLWEMPPQSSQFPFWDFGECNKIVGNLNSLSGISLNATL